MTERTLLKNTSYLTGALVIQKVLSFIYFWFISNNLFPNELGQYVFALSFATLFSIIVDLGLSPVLTREASKANEDSNKLLNAVLGIKIPLAIVAVFLIWLTLTFTGRSWEIQQLVYLASTVMIIDSFSLSFWVLFRAHHQLKYESIGVILVQIIIFSLGVTALFKLDHIGWLIGALFAASVFNFIFSAALLRKKLKFKLKPTIDKPVIKQLLKIVPAFAIAGIFVKIYNTADSVLLGYLDSEAAVGFFAVPAKIVYAFQQVIPAAFAAVIFPAFSYYYKFSRALLSQTFTKAIRYLLIVSVPLATGLALLAQQIIELLWPEYQPVTLTFVIMALALPFIFLGFPTGYLLNACDRQKINTINRGIITVVAVVLNIILIPRYSYLGAGIAFLSSNVLLLILDWFWIVGVTKIEHSVIIKQCVTILLATGCMTAIIIFSQSTLPLLTTITLAILGYFTALWLFKGFRFSELSSTK